MTAYQKLEKIFEQLAHLHHIHMILMWDEATMMPAGGGRARAEAMATLKGIQHERMIDPRVLELIEQAETENDLSAWQKANVEWISKKTRVSQAVPVSLIKELTSNALQSEQAWRQYRAENNWREFFPYLEKIFSLVKEGAEIRAEILGFSVYDALIDEYSPGITQAIIDPIFHQLKSELPPLIDSIIAQQKNESLIIPEGPFDISKQQQLGKELMTAIGFDFNHGRLDMSLHPFCGGIPEDTRMTTRYREEDFIHALLAICHETGHALYQQALPNDWRLQPVGEALGMSVHESQSLIIEMQACRSREFIHFLSDRLKNYFEKNISLETDNLYRLVKQVKRSLIRVEADEVTYPLHVILRYEIEKDLFLENIEVRDLPEIWDFKMKKYLDISTQGNDRDGVMQDVHWPSGIFGYFPAYTLGRLMAAQFFKSAVQQHPSIISDLSRGDFTLLKKWLNENVHAKASSITNEELLKRATGESLNPNYFIQHIKDRY